MAYTPGYRIIIQPIDQGTSNENDTLRQGVAKIEGSPHLATIAPSSAQIQGVMGYLALIKAGVNTATVEAAITALAP